MRNRIVSMVCAALAVMLVMMIWSAAALADAPPKSVVLSEKQIVIDLAESKYATLRASTLPATADQDVDWSSSNRDVVRTSSSGRLTARSVGTAVITAVSEKNTSVRATCRVTVIDSDIPERIVLSKKRITLDLAKTDRMKLTASAEPAKANQRVNWKTNSSSIARVSSSGEVTARKVGTTVIRAYSREDSKVYAECVVNVIDSSIPDRVVLNKKTITLDLARTSRMKLTASAEPAAANQRVNWKTNSSSIARVSSSGEVTARRVGTTVIRAYSREDSKIYAECIVNVIDSSIPERVVLNKKTITLDLAKAESITLSASAEPAIANQRVKWKIGSSSIARVSSSGKVTARKVGTTVVKAYSYEDSDIYAECTVRVIDTRIPTSISLKGMGSALTMARYEKKQLTPVAQPSVADPSVKWKSSKSSVVSVSSSGVLTAKKGGTATITCYSKRDDSVKAVLQVTVKQYPTPDKIELSPATTVMVKGEKLQLTPITYPKNTKVCEYFEWDSSSSSRASVDENGLVTAKKTGWVTITCASEQNSRVKATRKILIVTPDSPHYIHIKNKSTGALLNEQTITVNPTDTIQLISQVLPAGKNGQITWKSSRTSYATVDEKGLVTAKKAGSVTITATSKANKEVTATFKLNIVNLPAPDAIKLTAASHNLEITDTLKLTATTLPAGEKRSQEFKWDTSSSSIARVSSDGVVTPRKLGTVTITVKSARNSRVKATYVINVVDSKLPDSVTLAESGTITIENGQKLPLHATVYPSTATQTLKWTSSSSSRVKVDQNGVVTGVKSGSATISAVSTYSSKKKDTVKIKVVTKAAPTALALSAQPQTVKVGKTTRLTVTPTPATASVLGTYTSSNPAVATVNADGVVTAHRTGTAVITLTSLKNSRVKGSIAIVVYDNYTPGGVTLSDSTLYMVKGDTRMITASVFPATAPQKVSWSSSNSSIVSVGTDGKLTAKSMGTCEISASTANGLTARCKISVTSDYVATTIPARTTAISGIAENLRKINDIKDSAKSQILNLFVNGKISASENTTRQTIIDRAFEMQAFPWMTKSIQPYWTSEFAYKQYLPGNVYYGLPYIQTDLRGNDNNREYNVEKAVRENRYTDSGKGYYLLNRDKLIGGMYAGNDCSAFMGIAQYGINHPAAFIRTKYLATSSYYETINYSQMRPGDMLVLARSHTIMFLYWVDAAHTQMMIIEQGGDGNTVICSIKDLAFYSSQGYIARRRVEFN